MGEKNDEEHRRKLKQDYIRKMKTATRIRLRPRHILCLLCIEGNKESEPSPNHTAFEILQKIKSESDVEIKIWKGLDDVCISCPNNAGEQCIAESAIEDLKKDRDTLEKIGLEIGTIITARKLYALVMQHIPHVTAICAQEHSDWVCAMARKGYYENAIKKRLWK